MILIIVLDGPPQAIANATQLATQMANGWRRLAPNVLLINSAEHAQFVRDYLGTVPGAQVGVVRVTAQWATRGMPELALWLQGAAGYF